MTLTNLWGPSSMTFDHSREPISFSTDDGRDISLLELCEHSLPPCWLSPWLFNGHLQTIAGALARDDLQVYYKRQIFEADRQELAGTFAVDFAVETFEQVVNDSTLPPQTKYMTDDEFKDLKSADSKPMLIVLHGISGGSHELYLRHLIAYIQEHAREDWQICVLNGRGCGLSKLTSNLFFSPRATWDLRQLVHWIQQSFPNRPIFAVGFSLGATLLTNYLGEEGENCMLTAAVSCSNTFNSDACCLALQRTWLGSEIYSRALARGLKDLIEREIDDGAAQRFPMIDVAAMRRTTYLHEFDREVTAKVVGYPTAEAYYRDTSCSDALLDVAIPYLAINARDDPIAPPRDCIPFSSFRLNPYTILCTTPGGGHVAWLEQPSGKSRWSSRAITAFLEAMLRQRRTEDFLPRLRKLALQRPSGVHVDGRAFMYEPSRRRMFVPSSSSTTTTRFAAKAAVAKGKQDGKWDDVET